MMFYLFCGFGLVTLYGESMCAFFNQKNMYFILFVMMLSNKVVLGTDLIGYLEYESQNVEITEELLDLAKPIDSLPSSVEMTGEEEH